MLLENLSFHSGVIVHKGWNSIDRRYKAHSRQEGRYLFQYIPIQKYPKLKELPGKGLLNIKNQ